MIKSENGKYVVYNESGDRRLSKTYDTEEEAKQRLAEIELFKHSGQDLAIYNGSEVLLNSPVRTPEKDKKYQVYSTNGNGDVVSVRFNGEPTAIHSDDPATPAYWNEFVGGAKKLHLMHRPYFDSATKTIRSVRDGVQEYYGFEIGMEPSNKIFTIYRSPEEIAKVASMLGGLPITNNHVDVDSVDEVLPGDIIGAVRGGELVEFNDPTTNSSLYIENPISMDDKGLSLKDAGRNEFSLGYNARLRPGDKYDFEQFDFTPTHLALVDSARGGSVLTFVDKKVSNMLKIFQDADGKPNLQQIVEIAQALPEALKTVPIDQVQEMLPTLQAIIAAAGGAEEQAPASESDDEEAMVDSDMSMEDMDEEEAKKFGDSKLYKSISASVKGSFADSKAFKDAVDSAVKRHAEVIQKAAKFVDEQYSFADKSTAQIMRDALATQCGEEKFEDSELATAFKMLKRAESDLSRFGDSVADSFETLKDKEL